MDQDVLPPPAPHRSPRRKRHKKISRNRNEMSRRTVLLQLLAIVIILAILGLVRWYGG